MSGFDEAIATIHDVRDTVVEESRVLISESLVDELKKGAVNLPSHPQTTERVFYHELDENPSVRSFHTEKGQTSLVLDIALDGSRVKLDDKRPRENGGGVFEVNMQGNQVILRGEELGSSDPRREKVVEKVMGEVHGLEDRLTKYYDNESILRTDPGL